MYVSTPDFLFDHLSTSIMISEPGFSLSSAPSCTNNDSWQGKLPWDSFLGKLYRLITRSSGSAGDNCCAVLCILVGILEVSTEAQVMTEDALLSSLSKPGEAVEAV